MDVIQTNIPSEMTERKHLIHWRGLFRFSREISAVWQAEYVGANEAVAEYRRLIAMRDAATTEIGRADAVAMLAKLGNEWRTYNGGDDAELATTKRCRVSYKQRRSDPRTILRDAEHRGRTTRLTGRTQEADGTRALPTE